MNGKGNNFNFAGMYRAKVIDNKDPDRKAQVKVEILLSDKSNLTAWASAANNPIGGRNEENPDQIFGSLFIPPNGSLVYIFFEGGNINRPRYFSGLDIEYSDLPPENLVGTEYQDKITIYRSPMGRVIIISDDPDDERVEIAGKKRKALNKDAPEEHVYSIKDNQSVFLIDDRDGKEKILIKDYKGNYIKIDTVNNEIEIEALNDMKIKTGGNTSLTINGDVNAKITGDLKVESNGNAAIDANTIFLNCGRTADPDEPDGKRDDTYE